MATSTYSNARKIFDFFMEKIAEDSLNQDAIFAQQYAHLNLMKFRVSGIKNSLESYRIVTD